MMRGILFLLLMTGVPGHAATVTKIDAEKKIITLDEGTDTQFVKKARVCFYDAAGTRAGCSFIRTAKAKTSIVKIKGDKLFAKIQVGATAKLEAAPVAPGTGDISGEAVAATSGGADQPHSYVNAVLLLPLAGPISYQNLMYQTPLGQQVDSMWSGDSPVSSLGFGLELGLGIGSMQLSAGGRMRSFQPKKISADYQDEDQDAEKTFEQYIESVGTGSGFGAWLDLYWLIVDFGVVDFRLGTGVDFDSSSVSFEAKQLSDLNDSSNTMYAGKSSLTAISLRLLPTLDFIFGPIDFSLGAVIYVPVSQASKFTLDTQADPFTSSLNSEKTPEEDLKAALKHEAKPGADLILSAGFVF